MAGHGVIRHTFLQHIEVIVLLRLLLLLPRKVWVVETARLPYGTGVGLGLVDARGHSRSCTWRERSLGEFRWRRSWERRILMAKKSRMLAYSWDRFNECKAYNCVTVHQVRLDLL
jgi:hypothetical protein